MKARLERFILLELNQEFSRICRDRKLNLKPVSIQLFDSPNLWGQFDGLTRTLSISRRLVNEFPWNYVMGVFRHEMAHQWVYENFPGEHDLKPHGEKFQKACQLIGVPAPFTKARVGFQDETLDWKVDPTFSNQDRLLEKVKKLLALAQSANEHEAGLAMRKVQELYAQYNLDVSQTLDRSQFVHTVIANGKTRQTAWEQRVISLLIEFFFVEIVIFQNFDARSGEKTQAFEMIGTRENVLMAEYVYHFLLNQIEMLLKKNPLVKSRMGKSSFRLGILEGFAEKLRGRDAPTESRQTISRALVQFKNDPQLESYLKEIYPRLTTRRSASRYIDPGAYQAGQKQGQKLNLNRPIEEKKSFGGFLGFRK